MSETFYDKEGDEFNIETFHNGKLITKVVDFKHYLNKTSNIYKIFINKFNSTYIGKNNFILKVSDSYDQIQTNFLLTVYPPEFDGP